MNILSHQQRNFDANLSLTGTKISSHEDTVMQLGLNEDILHNIIS